MIPIPPGSEPCATFVPQDECARCGYDAGEHADRVRSGAAQTALEIIGQYGGIDGAHHKQWVLDQVVRALTGDGYATWVAEKKAGEDGPDTYSWDEGVAP